jgi:hypothetical protein
MFTLIVALTTVASAAAGPCDITGKAGNPCVAAHSTVRALYATYDGALYNVTRSSDGKSANISVLADGSGFANITTHDTFCAKLDCVISNVFDQSPQGNHLHQRHKLVNASQHKITVGDGISVYGMWFDPGYGYHTDNTTGIATGNDPESIYAVMSGDHYNGKCCFDYGNSETDDHSDGAGTMEAIYFGNAHWQGNSGDESISNGPWVGADLECGMYYGGGNHTKVNNQSKALPFPFVTLYLRGGINSFALKGGDATRGTLMTMYDGPRPDCAIAGTCQRHGNHTYQPMTKKGAIILATGGDNSNGAQGKFYEGIMVTGDTSDETDDAVQANIISVGYTNLPTPAPTPPPPAPHCVEVGKSTCYGDSRKNRIMGNFVVMDTTMTREECMQLCYARKKTLAGVENGKQCMCGDSLKNPKPSTICKKKPLKCVGDNSENCGGFDAIDIMHFTCSPP